MEKLLSSYRGEITRILLIDRIEVPKKFAFKDVLSRFRGLIEAIYEKRSSSAPPLMVEILIQHDFDQRKEDDGVNDNQKIDELNKFHYANRFSYAGKIKKKGDYRFRLLRPNIDFGALRRQKIVLKDTNIDSSVDSSWISVWARDPFLVLELDESPILLKPYHPWPGKDGKIPMANNHFLPEILTSQLSIHSKSFPYFVHGGNVLVAEKFAVIGRQMYEMNLFQYEGNLSTFNKDAFLPTLKAIFGVDNVYCVEFDFDDRLWMEVKDRLYHLDIYITLGGKTIGQQDVIFLADLMEWKEGFLENGEWKQGFWESVDPSKDKVQEYLNLYAAQLMFLFPEYLLVRLPLLIVNQILYSYNNCLIENPKDEKPRYYYPKFEWEELDKLIGTPHPMAIPKFTVADELVKGLLKKAEFEPIGVSAGFRAMASSHAGLDCMTCVLSRTKG